MNAIVLNAKAIYKEYGAVKLVECEEVICKESSGVNCLIKVESSTVALPEAGQSSILVGRIVFTGDETTKCDTSTTSVVAVGDRVVCFGITLKHNSLYTIMPRNNLIPVSTRLDAHEITCMLSSYYLSVYQCLTRVAQHPYAVQKGVDILIVGSTDFYKVVQQICCIFGVFNVTKYCTKDMEYYKRVQFDYILDTIGCSEYCPAQSLLRDDAYSSSSSSSKLIYIGVKRSMQWNVFSNAFYRTFYYNEASRRMDYPEEYRSDVQTLLNIFSAHQLHPAVHRVVGLDDISYAHEVFVSKRRLMVVCDPTTYEFQTEELRNDWGDCSTTFRLLPSDITTDCLEKVVPSSGEEDAYKSSCSNKDTNHKSYNVGVQDSRTQEESLPNILEEADCHSRETCNDDTNDYGAFVEERKRNDASNSNKHPTCESRDFVGDADTARTSINCEKDRDKIFKRHTSIISSQRDDCSTRKWKYNDPSTYLSLPQKKPFKRNNPIQNPTRKHSSNASTSSSTYNQKKILCKNWYQWKIKSSTSNNAMNGSIMSQSGISWNKNKNSNNTDRYGCPTSSTTSCYSTDTGTISSRSKKVIRFTRGIQRVSSNVVGRG